MTSQLDETVPVREITIRIPIFVAQKMAESFEGTLEDAAMAGLKLIHGMGQPAYATLQALAKQMDTSVPKTLREAISALHTRINDPAPPTPTPSPPPTIGRPRINTERDSAIFMRISDGQTYAEVAAAFGVSLVRVGQIVAQQRAMRGVNSRVELEARNDDILRRVSDGGTRQDVAAALGISRSVVDNLISAQRAKYGQPQKDLSLNVSTETPRARFVMPSLEAIKAQQVEQSDPRPAVERDEVDPDFGF